MLRAKTVQMCICNTNLINRISIGSGWLGQFKNNQLCNVILRQAVEICDTFFTRSMMSAHTRPCKTCAQAGTRACAPLAPGLTKYDYEDIRTHIRLYGIGRCPGGPRKMWIFMGFWIYFCYIFNIFHFFLF